MKGTDYVYIKWHRKLITSVTWSNERRIGLMKTGLDENKRQEVMQPNYVSQ